ncbi:GNAT family N-acetyltransferase [Deinococcus sp.]|uniref:GNAT family N-acetyltransferase n=1 Tax=Deinococcus sp. TaxID=47478 RepID=UPI003CC60DC3
MHPLDNPFWYALIGPQQGFALGASEARRYFPEVAPFAALREPSARAWNELAALLEPEDGVALFGPEPLAPPAGWTVRAGFRVLQMVYPHADLPGRPPGPDIIDLRPIVELGPADAPAMQALVRLTRPGPFAARTHELGAYWGVRHGQTLVGMAGERARLPGYTEVSAVCVHPEMQRRGLAAALVLKVVGELLGRGEVPFLHVALDNPTAHALYLRLGFEDRAELAVTVVTKAR